MIIVWKGLGGTVIFIGLFAFLLMNILGAALFNDYNFVQANLLPKLVALWITGLACWFIGRYFNRKPKRAIDPKTGGEIEIKPYHHLMFIKMEYWGVIFFIISLVLVIRKVMSIF
jgi:hypothetical protein